MISPTTLGVLALILALIGLITAFRLYRKVDSVEVDDPTVAV